MEASMLILALIPTSIGFSVWYFNTRWVAPQIGFVSPELEKGQNLRSNCLSSASPISVMENTGLEGQGMIQTVWSTKDQNLHTVKRYRDYWEISMKWNRFTPVSFHRDFIEISIRRGAKCLWNHYMNIEIKSNMYCNSVSSANKNRALYVLPAIVQQLI